MFARRRGRSRGGRGDVRAWNRRPRPPRISPARTYGLRRRPGPRLAHRESRSSTTNRPRKPGRTAMKTLQIALLAFLSLTSMARPRRRAGSLRAARPPTTNSAPTSGNPPTAPRARSSSRSRRPKGDGFGTLMQMIAADDYRGGRWKLIRAHAHGRRARRRRLWMRVDGPDRKVNAFDNMDDRPVTGDSEWKRYEIVLDVAPRQRRRGVRLLSVSAAARCGPTISNSSACSRRTHRSHGNPTTSTKPRGPTANAATSTE